MKCLAILVTTTIVWQIASSTPSIRRRRGYDRIPDHSIITSSEDDHFIHPPWWRGPRDDIKSGPLKPNGPFGSYESSDESSSEEDQENISQSGPTRTPGFGGPIWWGPPGLGSSTTERINPTEPSNPNGNNKNEKIASCIKSCPVTAEFNPVCGSNNVTYSNPGRLECEQSCGIDVQLNRLTACSVPPPNQTPSPNQTEGNPSFDDVAACVRNCPVTTEYNPVCGSNNVTYANHGRLLCEQFCGVRVQLSKLSPCSSSEPPPEKPLTVEEQRACMRSCSVTGEYNPVCGSNNVTYSNPGRLECAQSCGVAVNLIKKSSCGGSEAATTTTTTTTTENTYTIAGFTAACMRACPVTSEFNPVCGSNNVTYTNPGRLECAQTCGIAVTLTRKTSCEAPLGPEENKNNKTTTELNPKPTPSSTTARPYINSNGENNLNIGNNDINNYNDSANNKLNNGESDSGDKLTDLNNEKKVNNSSENKGESNLNAGNNNDQGEDFNGNKKNNEGQANLDGERKETSGPKERPGSGDYGGNNFHGGNGEHDGYYGNKNCLGVVNNRRPPSLEEVMDCMQTCSLTSETNPVCGTDSITYRNPGRLLCAQFCGLDVKVKKFAPCATSVTNVNCLTTCTNPPVTDNPQPVTPPIPSIEACMEACPASHEFRPVCGSNNVTYRNLEKLQCAKRCGINVSLKRSTHCSAPEISPDPKDNAALILECIQQCYVPQKYEPLCGSNNVTYNNTGHLICARQCGLDIQVKELHPCSIIPDVTTSPSPLTSTTTEKVQVVNPGQNGLNFTIDPAVLANIWGTTSATPKDDDDDFELDQRVQDKV